MNEILSLIGERQIYKYQADLRRYNETQKKIRTKIRIAKNCGQNENARKWKNYKPYTMISIYIKN